MRSPVSTIISILWSGEMILYLDSAPAAAAGKISGNNNKMTLLDMVFKNEPPLSAFSRARLLRFQPGVDVDRIGIPIDSDRRPVGKGRALFAVIVVEEIMPCHLN